MTPAAQPRAALSDGPAAGRVHGGDGDALVVAARGIDLTDEQGTKTRRVLVLFSARIAETATA